MFEDLLSVSVIGVILAFLCGIAFGVIISRYLFFDGYAKGIEVAAKILNNEKRE